SLLLVDGYDEITPDEQALVCDFFKLILQNYPETKIVTTGAPEYLDGLIPLGFVPLAIAAWSSNQNQKFLDQWGQLWNQTIAKEAFSQTAMMQPVDPLLLNAWLGP